MEQPNKFKQILVKLWPTIYKIINTVVYFFFNLIRSIVKGMIAQLKGM